MKEAAVNKGKEMLQKEKESQKNKQEKEKLILI